MAYKHFLRTLLISILWLSLLIAPYAFLKCACYIAFCGGPIVEAVQQTNYVAIAGFYSWLYPIIVFGTLYTSRKLYKTKFNLSIYILVTPIIILIPFAYAEMIEYSIVKSHNLQQAKYSSTSV